MQDFHKLLVWQKAHRLAVTAYRASLRMPRVHQSLASQMRRAAASIPTNLAEGCGHQSRRELARFVKISAASASELEYHLLLAMEVGALHEKRHEELEKDTREVRRMLVALLARLSAEPRVPNKTQSPAVAIDD